MAQKESPNAPKQLKEPIPEEVAALEKDAVISQEFEDLERSSESEVEELTAEELKSKRDEDQRQATIHSWVPKTQLGKEVKSGKIKNIDEILGTGKKILEYQIVDSLLRLESDLLAIGQSKGKFGGGKRRAWRQTQKKTMEGNVLTFSSMAVVGDKSGHVGIGYGRSKETLPAREKAIREAKLSLIKIKIGFETPEGPHAEPHTVPFKVSGKCGSVRVTLIPAPRGTGLVCADEAKKILRLAGIKDVYGVTKGSVRTTFNLAKACIDALKKTNLIQ
jgi:small subunit ribosomal protein S5